ncbi:hypothetical protein BSL78_19162 [Apostichopus japonicus]|uniref:Vesicle transport protein n=1 Tax=Stichopus japonicus TaxID=307972 RepID=A0A2G8K7K5_STIJA|nr:hypothetical protein BSL78_19162 [Apostichopus japonicus]
MDKLRKMLQGEEEEPEDEENIITQIYEGTSLSWSTRVKGFTICFVTGCVLAFLSVLVLLFPTSSNLAIFAVFYSLGNITIIAGSLFLMGPVSQAKRMFKENRIIATIVFLVFLILTVCAAVWWGTALLAILFCVIQFLAFAWYAISYIPYARDVVKKCFGSIVS